MSSWEALELMNESEDHWLIRCKGISDKVKNHKRYWAISKRKKIIHYKGKTTEIEWETIPEPEYIKKLRIAQDSSKSWDDVPELPEGVK